MKTIYITEAQKKKIKKAIAAQDQVGGKVNAGVMDAVAYGGGMCENVEEDEYELGAEKGMSPYYHVNESNEEIITLYHGVNRKGLEFNLENGGFIPRVCSEGGPKAVWLSEKQYNYEFTFAFDFPKSLVEQLSNVDYVYGNKIGFDEFNCRLVKSNLYGRIDSRTVVEVNLLDERLSKIQFRYFPDLGMLLWKEYKEFPLILEKYINPYIEKYQTLSESKKKVVKNDKGEIVPETCDKCGGKVVVQIHGEPVYVCKDCGKYFGTMPFTLKENKLNENIEIEDKWNGDKEKLEPLKRLKIVPPVLYHASYKKNRESILKNGIYASVGFEYSNWWSYNGPNGEIPDDDELEYLVFLSTKPTTWSDNFYLDTMDIYEIDTKQLDKNCFYLDPTKDLALKGSICYTGNIPPSAIKLYDTKYFGKSVNENIESEIVNPEDIDLSSFNIKKNLNPKFWKNGVLDSRIRLKLLDIADDFIEFLGIDWAKPEDITMTGSLANFNWDENYSDIDLHIIMDYSDVDEKTEFVSNYFYSQKKLWNDEHSDITIMGYPVEVFVQDVNERHDSSGVYSLEKNKWLIEPEREKLASSKVNKAFIKDKVSEYMNKIDKLEYLLNKSKDDEYRLRRVMEKSDKLFDKIKGERKIGFERSGGKEINNYNIVFKALRRNGYIEKLVNVKSMAYDKLNSLQ